MTTKEANELLKAFEQAAETKCGNLSDSAILGTYRAGMRILLTDDISSATEKLLKLYINVWTAPPDPPTKMTGNDSQ